MGGMPVPPSLAWATQEMQLAANTTVSWYSGGRPFATVLFEEGNEEQKDLARLWLDKQWSGSMILHRAGRRSDVGSASTRAIDMGDGTWHIEGVKRFITGGEHDASENIIHLVLARPEGAVPGTKGLSLFVVPKFLINEDGSLGPRNGVVATNIEKKMGLKGSTTCEMTFGADEPAIGYLVGDKHDGIRQMFRVIEGARMMIGTKSMGTLSTGYLNALEYAKERRQGADLTLATDKTAPRVPIIDHPDVRRMLMNLKAYSEGLRPVMYTAWVQDQARLHPEDDRWERRSDLLLPLVKGYSSEKAYEQLADALQIFGGSGFTRITRWSNTSGIPRSTRSTRGRPAFSRSISSSARSPGIRQVNRCSSPPKSPNSSRAGPTATRLPPSVSVSARCSTTSKVTSGRWWASDGLTGRPVGGDLQGGSPHQRIACLDGGDGDRLAVAAPRRDRPPEDRRRPVLSGQGRIGRWFIDMAAPEIAARRSAAETEDGALMTLPVEAF